MSAAAVPAALRSLVETGVALSRRSRAAQVAIARLDGILGDDLPPRLRREIDAALASTCTPLERGEIERALKAAWNEKPGKVLDDLADEPLAIRPASVVLAGEVDGRSVAIKVQRPGLAAIVRNDLVLLDALRAPLGAAFPRLDAAGVLHEVREAALDELDLEHEGTTQRLVGRALRDLDDVVVPRVLGDLTTETVLVSERFDGAPLPAGTGDAALAERLLRVHLHVALHAGMALTDPRPGHVLLAGDGTIGLLGAGVARPVDAVRVRAALDALVALRADDGDAFRAAVAGRLGVLADDDADAAFGYARDIGRSFLRGAARLDHDALDELAVRGLDVVGPLFGLAARGALVPADVSAARGTGQLAALLARIGATADWVPLARDAARAS